MAKPTPGVPEVIVPRSPPESPSKSAVRCSRMSLSQNQWGPGCAARGATLPTVAGPAARAAAPRSAVRNADTSNDGRLDRQDPNRTIAAYSTHGPTRNTSDLDAGSRAFLGG